MPKFLEKDWENPKKSIVEVSRRLYERGYLVAVSGNVSVRTKDGFFISPTCTRKDSLATNLVVHCGKDGCSKDKNKVPSCECPMHKAVYETRPDIGATIHAHPPYTLACDLAQIDASLLKMPELVYHIGKIAKVEYAEPGSKALASKVAEKISSANAVILKNHGVLVIGKDIKSAFNLLEHLEHLSKVAYLVFAVGGTK